MGRCSLIFLFLLTNGVVASPSWFLNWASTTTFPPEEEPEYYSVNSNAAIMLLPFTTTNEVTDHSSRNNNVSLPGSTNNPTWVPYDQDTGVSAHWEFSGDHQWLMRDPSGIDFLVGHDAASLVTNTSWSLWVRIDEFKTEQYIWRWRGAADGIDQDYHLVMFSSNLCYTKNFQTGGVHLDLTNTIVSLPSGVLGKWLCLQGTMNSGASVGAQDWEFYTNGILVDLQSPSNFRYQDVEANGVFHLGTWNSLGTGYAIGKFFHGGMDDFRFYRGPNGGISSNGFWTLFYETKDRHSPR